MAQIKYLPPPREGSRRGHGHPPSLPPVSTHTLPLPKRQGKNGTQRRRGTPQPAATGAQDKEDRTPHNSCTLTSFPTLMANLRSPQSLSIPTCPAATAGLMWPNRHHKPSSRHHAQCLQVSNRAVASGLPSGVTLQVPARRCQPTTSQSPIKHPRDTWEQRGEEAHCVESGSPQFCVP